MYTKLLRLNLNQLLLSNMYLGDNVEFLNTKVKSYLLGKKENKHLINVLNSQIQLRILVRFIINLVSLRQKILVVRDLDFFHLGSELNNNNIYYYGVKWVGGSLTNHRVVRVGKRFKKLNKFKNTLAHLRYMPSLVVFSNPTISKWALLEASNLEIPITGLVNTSSKYLNLINFPVVGNNSSYESIYFYLSVIKNAVLKGQQKERLKVLKIM